WQDATRSSPPPSAPLLLVLENFSLLKGKTGKEERKLLRNAPLELHTGEIVGVAGVDGNGQTELAESLIGLRTPAYGTLYLQGQQIKYPTPAALRAAGAAFIPQDRRKEGLVLSLSVEENLLINTAVLSRLTHGFLLPPSHVRRFAEEQISRFSITSS